MADFAPIIIKAEGDHASAKSAAAVIVNEQAKALDAIKKAVEEAAEHYASTLKNAADAAGTSQEAAASKAANAAKQSYEKSGNSYSAGMKRAQKDAKQLGIETEAVGKKAKKAGKDASRAFSDGFVQSLPLLGEMLTPISRMAIGIGLVQSAFKRFYDLIAGNIIKLTEQGILIRDTLLNAKWFNVPIEQGPKIAGILDDVKSKMDALSLAIELKQIGLSEADTEQFANTINVLAAFTGQSKSAIEASLKSASVTDRQLAVLNKTRIGLQVAMAQAQADAGGRSLDANERVQVMIRFLGVTKESADALGNLGKSSPWGVMQMQLKDIWQSIVKNITPALLGVGEAFVKITQGVAWFTGAIGKATSRVVWLLKKTSEMLANGGALTDEQRKNQVAYDQEKARLAAKDAEDTKQRVADITEIIKGELVKRGYIESEADKKQRELQANAAKNRAKLRDQEKKEYLDELIGRMKSARALLRNFDREQLKALSTSGVRGVGSVIAGMSKAIELARTFSSILGKGFQQGNSSAARKATDLLEYTLEAGRGGLAKLITGEKQRTNDLRAQVSLSKHGNVELKIKNQILEQEKSSKQAIAILDKTIVSLAQSNLPVATEMIQRASSLVAVIEKETKEQSRLLAIKLKINEIDRKKDKGIKDLDRQKKVKAEARNLEKMQEQFQRLSGTVIQDDGKSYLRKLENMQLEAQKINLTVASLKEKQKLLTDPESQQILKKQIADRTQILGFMTKEMDVLKRTVDLSMVQGHLARERLRIARENAALQRKGDINKANQGVTDAQASLLGTAGTAPANAAAQALSLQLKRAENDIRVLQDKQITTFDKGAHESRQSEIKDKLALLAIEQDRLVVIEQLARKQEFEASRIGQVVLTQARNASQAIAGLFSDLVAAPDKAFDNLGKAILSSFGDMAFQIGSFFAATGLGMLFIPGSQANGVGLIAASAALYAVGGALKGVASTIGAKPAKPASTGGGRKTKEQIPGSADVKGEQSTTINNYYNGVPWRGNRAVEQDFRDMARYTHNMQRATGVSLVPRIR